MKRGPYPQLVRAHPTEQVNMYMQLVYRDEIIMVWFSYGVLWFSFGFPMVLVLFSYSFLMVSCNFPLVFLWFSYGPPMTFEWLSCGFAKVFL